MPRFSSRRSRAAPISERSRPKCPHFPALGPEMPSFPSGRAGNALISRQRPAQRSVYIPHFNRICIGPSSFDTIVPSSHWGTACPPSHRRAGSRAHHRPSHPTFAVSRSTPSQHRAFPAPPLGPLTCPGGGPLTPIAPHVLTLSAWRPIRRHPLPQRRRTLIGLIVRGAPSP
jgi:hypothetical protein